MTLSNCYVQQFFGSLLERFLRPTTNLALWHSPKGLVNNLWEFVDRPFWLRYQQRDVIVMHGAVRLCIPGMWLLASEVKSIS